MNQNTVPASPDQSDDIQRVIVLGLEFNPFSGKSWREFPGAEEGSLCCATDHATLILTPDRKRVLEYPYDGGDGDDFVREWQLDYSA
jgi:hypothetical protein